MEAGWNALSAAVATAREEIAAASPDPATAAEGEAYLVRLLTACLAEGFLGHLLRDGGLSRALPTRGGPNPDYLMSHAPVQPDGRYRVEGRLNGSERVGVGLYSFSPGGDAHMEAYAAFDAANAGADGSFSLDIAADADGRGAMAIPPAARSLVVRVLHRDARADPARVRLEGGPAARDLTLATGSAGGALEQAGRSLLLWIRQYLKWTNLLSAQSNRIGEAPPSLADAVIGDANTRYWLGYYELKDGEWLEILMPRGLDGYWSLNAYNHWMEQLPGAGAHDRNTSPDDDGRIRIGLGPNPPAVRNRIDTLGRRRGVLILRAIGGDPQREPETQLRR